STNGGQTFGSAVGTLTGSFDQPTIKAGAGTFAAQQAAWLFYLSGSALVARGMTSTGLGTISAVGSALSIPSSSGGNFGDITIGPGGKVAVAFQIPSGGAGTSSL